MGLPLGDIRVSAVTSADVGKELQSCGAKGTKDIETEGYDKEAVTGTRQHVLVPLRLLNTCQGVSTITQATAGETPTRSTQL